MDNCRWAMDSSLVVKGNNLVVMDNCRWAMHHNLVAIDSNME
jgi:hypothetical protein